MNKTITVIFAVVLLALTNTNAIGQIRKIPASVTNSFTEKYPGATDVEWKDKLTAFSVNFTLDSLSYLATFSNSGDWENTEQEIDQQALPETVSESFSKSKYADWDILKVHKIELPDDAVQYRVEAGKGDIKKRNLYFNSKGRLLKDPLTL